MGRNVEILCITEHHRVHEDLLRINIPGFKLATSYCRDGRKSKGGSCIYIRNGINYVELTKIKDMSSQKLFEISGIDINGCYVLCVYRPKTVTNDHFIQKFENVLNVIFRHKERKVIVCGDFNIDTLVESAESKEFLNLLQSHHMRPFIREPTRITDHSLTCLDNIISNVDLGTPGVKELGLSDHSLQFASLNVPVKKDQPRFFKIIRNVKNTNLQKLLEQLLQTSWHEVYNGKDCNDCFNKFYDKVMMAFETCCPLIKVRGDVNKNSKNWLTQGIKKSCETKRELFINSKANKTPSDLKLYKRYSKILGQVIQRSKQMCNEQIIVSSNNKVKATWNLINTHISGKRIDEVRDYTGLTDNINTANSNLEAANIFITHFTNTCNNMKKQKHIKLPNFHQTSMFATPVNNEEITKKIRNLKNKKSCGYDGMSAIVIKYIAEAIQKPLHFVINKSLGEGIFPERLKIALIKPILKSGDGLSVDKYRPISLLPVFSKIFEKVMADQLRVFLCTNKILAKEQFGFQKDISTIDAIFEMTDFIAEALDNNENVMTVLLDLSKAFDHVKHDVLLDILYRYGIRGRVNEWFQSYLTERFQTVVLPTLEEDGVLNNIESSTLKINVGVPQGSILGPILFLLYVNNLPSLSKNKVILFADDVSVFFKFNRSDYADLTKTINESIDNIINWFDDLNLGTNVGKTKLIHFRNYNTQVPHLDIKANDKEIESVPYAKFLGIFTDCNLNWRRHVDLLVGKLSSFCYALRSLIKISTKKAALQAYFAFFQSRVIYGLAIWGGSVDIERIFVLQKRAIRILNNIGSSMESCRASFKELKLHTITALYIIELCKLIKRYPHKFPGRVPGLSERQNEKNKHNLEKPLCRTVSYMRATKMTAIKVYNNLPVNIKVLKGNRFIATLKDYLITVSPYDLDEFFTYEIS